MPSFVENILRPFYFSASAMPLWASQVPCGRTTTLIVPLHTDTTPCPPSHYIPQPILHLSTCWSATISIGWIISQGSFEGTGSENDWSPMNELFVGRICSFKIVLFISQLTCFTSLIGVLSIYLSIYYLSIEQVNWNSRVWKFSPIIHKISFGSKFFTFFSGR